VSLDRDQLLGIAHAERQRLGRMIQYADPETWEIPSACEGWWNRDVIAHLAAYDTLAAQLVADQDPSELLEYREQLGDEPFTVDGFNAWTVARRSGLETREVLDLWGRAAESFLVHASLLPVDAWRDRRFDFTAGPIAATYLVQSRVTEWWLHGEDVRATNGLGPHYQHWPIYLTIDLAVRMLPWQLSRVGMNAAGLEGLSVQIDAEGAGSGSWHWGLGAGEIPDRKKKPDAYIQGRAPQIALVAGGRLPIDDVLDSGNIVLGADRDLADLALRHLRAYP
jgi:uncharacterized protein (TIGR03083 family)